MGTKSDAIVAARVPEEIKEQVNAVLTKLGYTPTQLINSAYRYVMEFHQLPFESSALKPGKRVLDSDHKHKLAEELDSLQVCTYDYSKGGTLTFKEALAETRRKEYGAKP